MHVYSRVNETPKKHETKAVQKWNKVISLDLFGFLPKLKTSASKKC